MLDNFNTLPRISVNSQGLKLSWSFLFFSHHLTLIRSTEQNFLNCCSPQGNCMSCKVEGTKARYNMVPLCKQLKMDYWTHLLRKVLRPHPPLQIPHCHTSLSENISQHLLYTIPFYFSAQLLLTSSSEFVLESQQQRASF